MSMLIEMAVQSGVMILALIIFRPLLTNFVSARARGMLWLLPAIRLAIPFSIISKISMWRDTGAARETVSRVMSAPSPVPNVPRAMETYLSNAPAINSGAAQNISLSQLLLIIWIAGSAICLGIMIYKNVKFFRGLRGARKLQTHGKLGVYITPYVKSPCLAGVFKPRILLTSQAARDPGVMEMALKHEYAHYRRLDHIRALLRSLLVCAWWFNPLAWIAAKLSALDCECACDEAVIKKLKPEEREDYGMALISLVRRGGALPLGASAAMSSSKRNMKRRISAIANWRKQGVIALACALVIAAFITVIAFTSADDALTLDMLKEMLKQDNLCTEDFEQFEHTQFGSHWLFMQVEVEGGYRLCLRAAGPIGDIDKMELNDKRTGALLELGEADIDGFVASRKCFIDAYDGYSASLYGEDALSGIDGIYENELLAGGEAISPIEAEDKISVKFDYHGEVVAFDAFDINGAYFIQSGERREHLSAENYALLKSYLGIAQSDYGV